VRPAAAIAVAAGVAVLAGCGGSDVNTAQIERQIASRVAEQTDIDRGRIVVDCPQHVAQEKGRTFHCTLRYDGTHHDVVIKLEGDDRYSTTIETKTTP
jgi:hypothetical protein